MEAETEAAAEVMAVAEAETVGQVEVEAEAEAEAEADSAGNPLRSGLPEMDSGCSVPRRWVVSLSGPARGEMISMLTNGWPLRV